MKPKTKNDFEVIRLSHKLPRITKEHIVWAKKKLFKFYAYRTKHKAVCFECGHAWEAETDLLVNIIDLSCPKCKRKLEFTSSKSWSLKEHDYFEIVTTCGEYQVIRIFYMDHCCKKGYRAKYGCFEVYQHWISPKGKFVILGMIENSMASYSSNHICWSWGSAMEIRGSHDRYFVRNVVSYPVKKYTNDIKRNGYKGKLYNYNKGTFFTNLLKYPAFETLLKSGQTELLKVFNMPKRNTYDGKKHTTLVEYYWPQIKICIRNKYFVKDPTMWFDHMVLLEQFHKDIFSPKYICSPNLVAEHNALVKKKQDILNAQELEKLAKSIDKDNIEFNKLKSKYFYLNFTDGTIKIIVLDNVLEYFYEGKTLHHCVFQNEYYKKEDTLILSARKDDQRLETIEISLRNYAVLQIHGNLHQNTKYHKDIVKLINKSIPKIKKLNSNIKTRKTKVAS